MSLGAVVKYNNLETNLFETSGRQWDDPVTGNLMFCLARATYTPNATHATTADVGSNLITSGDGSPINVPSPSVNGTTTPGTTYYNSGSANFGSAVTIQAKYLICVQPVTAGTFNASTSKLLWYIDLNNTSSGSEASSTASDFSIVPQTNGWFKTV